MRLDHAAVVKNGVSFAFLLLKQNLLPVLVPIKLIKLIICVTVVKNLLSVNLSVMSQAVSMQVKQWMSSKIGGTVINPVIENI